MVSSPPSASSSSQTQQPKQIVSNLLRIACRFNSTFTQNPPFKTAAKLMSPNSDFMSSLELWQYKIYDFEMILSMVVSVRTMEEFMAGKPHWNVYFCPNKWKWLIITSFENPPQPMGKRCKTLPSFDSSFSSVFSSSTSTMTNSSFTFSNTTHSQSTLSMDGASNLKGFSD
ncbi:hypothetical protein BY996DRAFT_6471697 [Phakopsora pachyrhizi]|nr:hypothetical protein BY996DRAFT_6471697 [Phakopsora pachyrhizi]